MSRGRVRDARGGCLLCVVRGEDRVEAADRLRLAADHQAEAALEPVDAAAGADIQVVDTFGHKCVGAVDVVA